MKLWGGLTKGENTGLSWGISVLLAAVIMIVCIAEVPVMGIARPQEEYSVVLLGDSIIGNIFEGEGIPAYLEEQLGKKVLGGGFGGTSATNEERIQQPYSVKDQLNLVKLSEAIVNQDFAAQKAQIAYGEHYRYFINETLEYFPDTIRNLSDADFDKVEYLVIEHGTNDYNRGTRLDNPEDPYDETTFGGALRTSLELLQNAYPDVKIILMTPTWCCIRWEGITQNCDNTDFGGGYLEDYANLEIEIAKECGVYLLDNYHDSGICQETQDQYLVDGLHLNLNGEVLLASRLADKIREIENSRNEEQ